MSRTCSGLAKISSFLWRGEQAWELLIAWIALPYAVSGPAELPKLRALVPVSSLSGVALSWCHFLCLPPLLITVFLSHFVSVPFLSVLRSLSFKSPCVLHGYSQLALCIPLEASLWLVSETSISPSHPSTYPHPLFPGHSSL